MHLENNKVYNEHNKEMILDNQRLKKLFSLVLFLLTESTIEMTKNHATQWHEPATSPKHKPCAEFLRNQAPAMNAHELQ